MNERDAYNAKVAVVGSLQVGKTAIINAINKGKFSDEYRSTTSCTFNEIQLFSKTYNKKISLNVWDTVGQEKYQSLSKMFYKDAHIIILVYDITNEKSFNEINDIWLKDIETMGEQFKILILAGNKSDLYEEETVPQETAAKFAHDINAKLIFCSAKTNDGIREMFEYCADAYLDPNFSEKIQRERGTMIEKNKVVIKKDNKCKC